MALVNNTEDILESDEVESNKVPHSTAVKRVLENAGKIGSAKSVQTPELVDNIYYTPQMGVKRHLEETESLWKAQEEVASELNTLEQKEKEDVKTRKDPFFPEGENIEEPFPSFEQK